MLATHEELRLSAGARTALLDVARQTVALGLQSKQVFQPHLFAYPASLQRVHASFVKLYVDGELRGSAGTVLAKAPLVCDVSHNAHCAAFHNLESPALRLDELGRLTIEITVIGNLTELDAHSLEEAMRSIEPGKHGVLLRQGDHRDATFLPEIWERYAQPEIFFQQLKLKAGLPIDAWCPEIGIAIYTTQQFSSNALED